MNVKTSSHRPTATLIFVLFALFCGVLMAVQARINGQLGVALGNQVQAALISFGVGLLSLLVLLLIVPSMRRGLHTIPELLRRKELRFWHLLGGMAGAYFILAQVYSVPLIGVALFMVVGVAAESLTSMVIDRFGLSPAGRYELSAVRLAATAVVLIAVALASFDKLTVVNVSILAILAVFFARVGTTVQVTVNAKVAAHSRSYLAATLISFFVGTLLLTVTVAISVIAGATLSFDLKPWWLYTGGLAGLIAVAGGTVCIPRIGVLLYSLSGVAGSIIGSVLLDLLFQFADAQLTVYTLVGSGLALTGVIVAAEPLKHLRIRSKLNSAS